MDCMAYNNILGSYQNLNYKDMDMKQCTYCNTDFYARHAAKECGIKCKLEVNHEKIDNGCWLYKKSTSGAYGKIRWNKKWYSAHRVSYEVFKGPIEQGKWVCHSCDTPKCINPDHLFIGSPSENRKDAVNKKRVPLGEKNHFSKYTDKQVNQMRLLKNEGFTYTRLAEIFNCSFSYIQYVIKNKIRI